MEAGWCFVTGQNETTNMWWNQDLQVVVHIPRLLPLPYMYDTCSEYFLYIQNFTFLFSHRGNLNYCSLSMFYVCYIWCLCQARVNEHTGKQAWWKGVPRPQALFKKTFYFLLGYTQLRRRQWQPTPVLLPGKSHGQRSLVGCNPRVCWELDTTEQLHFHFSLSCTEGNGNPLQCSCLENPRDGGV